MQLFEGQIMQLDSVHSIKLILNLFIIIFFYNFKYLNNLYKASNNMMNL